MGDWLLNLPIPWMAFIIFAATYLIAACVYLLVVRLAVSDRGRRAFKAFSPGMLPVLGTTFALLVAFVAVQVWNDFDKAKLAVATEASASLALSKSFQTCTATKATSRAKVVPSTGSIPGENALNARRPRSLTASRTTSR